VVKTVPGDVRFGSKADITARPSDVRYSPESGLVRAPVMSA